MNLSYTDQTGHQQALVAIACFPDLKQAKQYMSEQGYDLSIPALETIRRNKGPELEKVREEVAPKLEASLANDMLDNARIATEVERLAIERTKTLLAEGRIADPSRVARDLSQIKTQSIDKRLALQGRPTQITEHRDVSELVNALVGMKVAEVVEVGALPEATDEEAP
jgi:hypothetical protein